MHFANIRHSTTPHIYHLLKRPLKFYLINETKKDGMKRSVSVNNKSKRQQTEMNFLPSSVKYGNTILHKIFVTIYNTYIYFSSFYYYVC